MKQIGNRATVFTKKNPLFLPILFKLVQVPVLVFCNTIKNEKMEFSLKSKFVVCFLNLFNSS